MYNIVFKNQSGTKGAYCNIESIIIDTQDILMMQYVNPLTDNDKNLMMLYAKFQKSFRKNKNQVDSITILNNSPENERMIASIIGCEWLINVGSLKYFTEELINRKEKYQNKIDELNSSKNDIEKKQCILMNYYIDSLNQLLDLELVKVKKV